MNKVVLFSLFFLLFSGSVVFNIVDLTAQLKGQAFTLFLKVPEIKSIHEQFDLFDGKGYQFFVDHNHKILDDPDDLVSIDSDFTLNNSKQFKLRKKAAEQFELMAWAFSHDFKFKAKFSINSAFRTHGFQKTLYYGCIANLCAEPWTSEHELGLALDLWVNGQAIESNHGIYFKWMQDNAYKYGFHNTYQRGVAVDWFLVEKRHWRYVWVDLANYLHKIDKTFAEYFYSLYPKD